MANRSSGPSRPQAVRYNHPPRLNAAQSADLRRKMEQAKPVESFFSRVRTAAKDHVSAILRDAKLDAQD